MPMNSYCLDTPLLACVLLSRLSDQKDSIPILLPLAQSYISLAHSGVKIGKDTHNRFWILHAIRGRWEAAEREQIIKNTAIADKAAHGLLIKTKIEQEGGSGGKESADNTIKNLAGLRVSKDRPTGDKALRADPFAAQVNVGNVYMVPAVWNNDYLSEMEFFPNSTFKDQMDASSGAFNDINGKMVVGGVAWATARRTG